MEAKLRWTGIKPAGRRSIDGPPPRPGDLFDIGPKHRAFADVVAIKRDS